MTAMQVIKLFTAGCFLIILSAWIAEAYRNGNRVWVWAYELLELVYEHWYLGMWRGMMRHMADPAYDYTGRHFR